MDGVTAAWRRWLGSPARDAVANRHAYVASIRERAAQDARRQVDEERLRIARELHDVVAHTMATINRRSTWWPGVTRCCRRA